MNKWADYLISAVRYADQQQGYITYVKVHEDQTRKIGKGYTWNRDEIIEALTAGKSLMTIYKKETGDWIKGLVVNLIKKMALCLFLILRNPAPIIYPEYKNCKQKPTLLGEGSGIS